MQEMIVIPLSALIPIKLELLKSLHLFMHLNFEIEIVSKQRELLCMSLLSSAPGSI